MRRRCQSAPRPSSVARQLSELVLRSQDHRLPPHGGIRRRPCTILKDRHWCVSFSSVDVHTNNFRNGLSIVSEDRGKDDINVKSLRTDVTGVSILNRLH